MTSNKVDILPLLEELIHLNKRNWRIPEDYEVQEDMLKTLMTISIPASLSQEYYEREAEYIEEKNHGKKIIDIDDISDQIGNQMYVHLGDITAIKADAIVNVGNEKLLGCFVPGHQCIDNTIHMAAGLGLRNACHEIMVKQGHDEAVGQAKITKGYRLPSKYVIHTVGPNVNGGYSMNQEEIASQLRSSYRSILEEANKYDDIHNIVFPSISTGLYGVPIKLASQIAIRTVDEYLKTHHHHMDKVVFDLYSSHDYKCYASTNRSNGKRK